MLALLALGAVLGLGACVGATEPATNVTNLSAQLNARGYTDDGPATWWWEYDSVKSDLGTANDTELCGTPPEADRRCGPAAGGSRSNQIPLSVTATGLTPNTTYYFRLCGQDNNDPSGTVWAAPKATSAISASPAALTALRDNRVTRPPHSDLMTFKQRIAVPFVVRIQACAVLVEGQGPRKMLVMRKIGAEVILFAGNSDPTRDLVVVRFEIGIREWKLR